jgi:hypothetical protein
MYIFEQQAVQNAGTRLFAGGQLCSGLPEAQGLGTRLGDGNLNPRTPGAGA